MPTITINFRLSKSRSGEQALYEVAGLTSVKEKTDDLGTSFTVNLTKNKVRHAFGLLKSLKRLKHKQILVDGKPSDFDTAFGFLQCYQKKLQLNSPPLYCYGNFDDHADHNVWSCVFASSFNFGSVKYGHWDQKRFKWIFDKRAIKKALLTELKGVQCCPAFDRKRLERIIAALPNGVNPYGDQGWSPIGLGLLDTPRNTKCARVKKANGIIYFIKGVFISGEEAIQQIAKKARTPLFDKGLEWVGYDDG